MLSPSDLAAFRKKLTAITQHAEAVRSELASEAAQQAATGDGEASDPHRPAEIHNRAAEEVVTSQLLGLEEGVERDALAALERIEAGTFGKCVKCGGWIAKGRLEALPYTRTCVKCAG